MTTVFRDLGQTHVGAIMHWISVCPNMQTCLQTSSDVVWWLISIVTTAISVPVNQYCDVESPSLVGPGSSMPVETIRLCWHADRLDWHGSRLGWHAGGADLCTRHGFGGQSGQSHASRDDPSLPACQQTRLRLCWHADRTDLCIRHSFVRGSPAGLLSQCVFRSRSDKICYL